MRKRKKFTSGASIGIKASGERARGKKVNEEGAVDSSWDCPKRSQYGSEMLDGCSRVGLTSA